MHFTYVRIFQFLDHMADVKYCAEYAKTGRSGCKKCKKTIEKGTCRIGKVTPNPFSDDGGDMKVWYHVGCMFESFQRARAATKVIETAADVEGFADLKDSEKDEIKELIKGTYTFDLFTKKQGMKYNFGGQPFNMCLLLKIGSLVYLKVRGRGRGKCLPHP